MAQPNTGDGVFPYTRSIGTTLSHTVRHTDRRQSYLPRFEPSAVIKYSCDTAHYRDMILTDVLKGRRHQIDYYTNSL